MDKAVAIAALIFVGFPLVLFTFLISWVLDDERMDKTKLCGSNNRSNLCDGCIHSSRSGISDDKGKVPIRCSDRQNLGEMGTEEMKEMLRILIQLIERIETL